MYRSLGRRLTFGAVAVAAAITFAAPAYAAAPTITAVLPDVTVAAGANTQLDPLLYADQNFVPSNGVMTLELSDGLDGVTLSSEYSECESDGPAKLTCGFSYEFGPEGTSVPFAPMLNAPESALGETGKVTMTYVADGIEKVTTTAEVSVAEAVDLTAGKDIELSVKPGADFDMNLQVTNTSDKVVHGVAIMFNHDYAFASPKQFSNCLYREGQVNTCTFDQDLQPGATYQVSVPHQLRKDTAAPAESANEVEWLTSGDYQDFLAYLDKRGLPAPGDKGTGGTLALKAKASVAKLAKQTDPDQENNWQTALVTSVGKQGTDFVAVGTTAKGAKGDVVTVPVGLRNDGPATVDSNRRGGAAAVAIITIPAGAEVATVPDGCFKAEDAGLQTNPKALQYACFSASSLFKAKTTELWQFKLKLTKDVSNAQGLVESNPACACDNFSKDINKKNDVAKIVINPIAGGGAGDGGSDGTDGTGGEGGGSLPITGPQTGVLGGAAAVLIAAGVVGFVLARRRRTRFEA
jgi:hypothetical protein